MPKPTQDSPEGRLPRSLDKFFAIRRLKRGYQYKDLLDASSFRVMELQTGKEGETIKIRLHFANWRSPPKYEATSYAWGEPGDVTECICEGQKPVITKSLCRALWHFRFPDKSRFLWADAVW